MMRGRREGRHGLGIDFLRLSASSSPLVMPLSSMRPFVPIGPERKERSVDRRTFLKKASLASLLTASGVQGLTGVAWAAAEQINFHFLTISANTADTPDVLVATGDGHVTAGGVVGSGSFVHADLSTGVPAEIVGQGTWKAKRLVDFHEEGRWGIFLSGTVVMEVTLVPEGGGRIAAELTMNCNLGPAGISTGLPEGIFLDIPSLGAGFEPTTFPGSPFPFGLTVFSTVVEERGSAG